MNQEIKRNYHTIFSTEAEKTFDNIPTLFHDKKSTNKQ